MAPIVPFLLTILSTTCCCIAINNDDSKTVEFRVYEELAVPHFLGNVKRDSGLDDPLPHQQNSTLKSPIRFHFKNSKIHSGSLDLFRLDETSGDLFVVQRLDRDAICPGSHAMTHQGQRASHRSAECSLTFDVVVKPLQYFKIIKVTVVVIDINDNSPRFQKKKTRLEIVESLPVGSLFLLSNAEDDDDGIFDVQEYQLLSQFNEFELKMAEHADGSVDARLKLISKLDRETRDNYEVTLIAIDGGRPPRSGSIVIEIIVLDSNDNPPVFEKSFYQAVVSEDSPAGTSILTLVATDKDLGVNADVTYAITDDQNLFGIDQQTGRLFLRHPLDYEQVKQHRITVSAFNEDSTEYSLTAMATVVILVDDVNDNSPQITINLLTSSQQAEVLENSALGLFVAHATVKDADSGSGGDITCSLVDQSNFRLESLFSNEYKITTGRTFDREVRDTYQATITCQDHGSPSLSSNRTLDITVLDENDNTPAFDRQLQIFSVPEDAPVGSQVVAMVARDEDTGRNGAVTYSMEEISREEDNVTRISLEKFSIDHLSGQIVVRHQLDFETKTKYKFEISAVDSGDPARTGSSTLVVNVVDVNDNPPRFERVEGYTFSTPENCTEDTFVGTVRATDKDSSSNFRLIKYSLHDATGTFKIDPTTGDIKTTSLVDRESTGVYHFTIVAENVEDFDVQNDESSFHFKRLSSSVNVSVILIDVNDNTPTFVYPNVSFQSIEIYRNVASYVGSPVVRCHATDPDEGRNAAVTYEIVYGNEDGKFNIDQITGMIYVAKILIESSELTASAAADDYDGYRQEVQRRKENKRTVFHLVLKASDSGDPPQSTVADLVIFLNDTLLSNQLLELPQGLSTSSTYIISVIGSLVGGVLVLCCLVWGMVVFCKVSHKRGRRANIGGMFHDEKYEKESNDALNLSKSELGLSVKSLNTWQSNGRSKGDKKTLRNSMPNLQRHQPTNAETTFVCRCSTSGLRSRLDVVDEVEKQKEGRSCGDNLISRSHLHAPVVPGEHSSLMSRHELSSNCCNIREDGFYCIQHHHLPKRSLWPYRSDMDSDSTCSDSGRGLSEDERSRQTKKLHRHRHDASPERSLVASSSLRNNKPQVSFRLSPTKQPPQLNLKFPNTTIPQLPKTTTSQPFIGTLPLLKPPSRNQCMDKNCSQHDAHIWSRTMTGVTSEI